MSKWISVDDRLPDIPDDVILKKPIVSGPFWVYLPNYIGTRRGSVREGVLWIEGGWGRHTMYGAESSRYEFQPTHWFDGQIPGWKPGLAPGMEEAG